MCKRFFTLALLAAFTLSLNLSPRSMAQTPSLSIQVDHPTAKVSPTLYGLMTEEINFSYDGGLYPELVRDRTIGQGWMALAHWTMVARGNSAVSLSADEQTGPSTALPRRPETVYSGSFYAKTDSAGVPVTVSLVNDETGETAATTTVSGLGAEWKQYTFALKTGKVSVSSNDHLILTLPRPATVWFDLVSLFPPTYHDRPFGNRTDLRAITFPSASSGRRPSARWSTGRRIPAPGITGLRTAWDCWSFWNGAKTSRLSQCLRSMPATQ